MNERKPTDIRCAACGTLFGKEQEDGTLVIKHRDLYRTIIDGTVFGPCRSCGKTVKWPEADGSSN